MEARILVADDHGIVRMGLVLMIKQLYPKATVAEVEDYKALSLVISKENYDLVILDVNMPNGTIQQAIDLIKIRQPHLKILIFSSQEESLYALRYLKMGANGFLHKLSSQVHIDEAISAMLIKGQYLSGEMKDQMLTNTLGKQENASPIESLSNRELEIAQELMKGNSLKDISNQLNLHVSTISTYKNRIFEKLDIQSVPDLISVMQVYN